MSDTWIPTMRLRFEVRGTGGVDMFSGQWKGPLKILQQCFVDAETGGEVWQDVPQVHEVQR